MATFNFSNLFRKKQNTNLAATPANDTKKRALRPALKAISRTRQDIANWNDGQNLALAEEPKNYAIQLIFFDASLDALLTSQIENRHQITLSKDIELKKPDGSIDEEQTLLLRSMPATRLINKAILEKTIYGYSLIELSLDVNAAGNPVLAVEPVPRTNIVPQKGLFYPDYSEDKTIGYRDIPEYGTYVLEFNSGGLGLLNKAIPHVLFKRFAQSCWSELCEIYGIPPRVMKTNTSDVEQLNRAEQMMKDMGAAAWFIIDESETFEWAQGVATNGDVYKNLINLCNNEMSLLISGAVIGQDTVNGNRSKDESAQEMLHNLVSSDMSDIEATWNTIVIPALVKLGILKGDVTFEFAASENTAELWKMTSEALKYMTVDVEWVKNKFGIEVTGERQLSANTDPNAQKLKFDFDFFA